MEDGVPFCPHCAAPQIRVAAVGPGPQTIPAVLEGHDTPAQASPSGLTLSSIQWSQALPTAALAGLVAALLMVIPLGAFGLGMLAAGALSVVLYHRRNPALSLTPGIGARLGAVSGAVGFGIFAVFSALSMLVSRGGGQLRAALLDAIQQSAARSPDPQAQELLQWFKTPAGLALMMCLALGFLFVTFLVLSSAGGALAAVLLRRRDHR